MQILYYLLSGLLVVIIVWLNILATIALRYDQTLNAFQRKAQTIIVWLVPMFGAAFILNLVWRHNPDAIPGLWIPWPVKKIIYGKDIKANKNRDERERHR